MDNIKSVPLPTHVTISVNYLEELESKAALLQSLLMAGLDKWIGYDRALFYFANAPNIREIKLGSLSKKHPRYKKGDVAGVVAEPRRAKTNKISRAEFLEDLELGLVFPDTKENK